MHEVSVFYSIANIAIFKIYDNNISRVYIPRSTAVAPDHTSVGRVNTWLKPEYWCYVQTSDGSCAQASALRAGSL